MFERDKLEVWKSGQSRDESISSLRKMDKIKHKDYKEIFRKWNRVYVHMYETILNTYLVEPAQKICCRRIKSKTRVLNVLSSYRDGKYSKLFKSLVPQIRNSIQHQDYIINPNQPTIIFYDRNKPPLPLTIEEYSEIFWECFFLTLAFDTTWFDLRSNIVELLLEKIDIVYNYFNNKDSKLIRREEGLSILDLALLIESGKIK